MAMPQAHTGLRLGTNVLTSDRDCRWASIRDFAGLTSLALAALVLTFACVLATRRMAGALETPLAPSALVTTGIAAAASVWIMRWLAAWAFPCDWPRWGRVVFIAAPAAVLLTLGVALSLPGTSGAALAAFWATLAVEEAWSLRKALTNSRRAPKTTLTMRHRAVPATPNDAKLTQQLSRFTAADGTETLTGRLRLEFAPAQRTLSAHVAFCPPFVRVPRFEFQQLSGPEARLKLGQLLPYGARVEAKLADNGHAVIELEFTATLPPAS